jgi:hypothetical protein
VTQKASQSEFEETITDMLYKQLKGIKAVVEQRLKILSKRWLMNCRIHDSM